VESRFIQQPREELRLSGDGGDGLGVGLGVGVLGNRHPEFEDPLGAAASVGFEVKLGKIMAEYLKKD